MAIQVLPLFLIPEILLPLLAPSRAPAARARGRAVPCARLRPRPRVLARVRPDPRVAAQRLQRVHARAAAGWIAIAIVQTLRADSARHRFFGKGVYCGWICSCGALAETLGDTHRHKMPHGPAGTGSTWPARSCSRLRVRPAGRAHRGLGRCPTATAADRVFEPALQAARYKWGDRRLPRRRRRLRRLLLVLRPRSGAASSARSPR